MFNRKHRRQAWFDDGGFVPEQTEAQRRPETDVACYDYTDEAGQTPVPVLCVTTRRISASAGRSVQARQLALEFEGRSPRAYRLPQLKAAIASAQIIYIARGRRTLPPW